MNEDHPKYIKEDNNKQRLNPEWVKNRTLELKQQGIYDCGTDSIESDTQKEKIVAIPQPPFIPLFNRPPNIFVRFIYESTISYTAKIAEYLDKKKEPKTMVAQIKWKVQ